MKKFTTSLLLLTSIFFFTTYVSNAEETTASATAVNTDSSAVIDLNNNYTVSQLQDIAVRNSRQAIADDMDIKKKDMAVRTVRSDSQAMSDSILSVTKPMDVALELEVAKKTKQDHQNQLKVDVYKTAMSIKLCEKEIYMQQQKLATAENQLVIAKARFRASSITQNDLDSAQYNVDDKKVTLENTRAKLNSLYLDLKRLLNQPLDSKPVKIDLEIKQEGFEDIDIDYHINRIYTTDTLVYKASGKLDIANKAMEIADKLYKTGDLFYDSAVLDLDTAKYDLISVKTALEIKVKNAYNIMVNKQDDLRLASQYTDLVKKKLTNSELKYKKGTISKDVYMRAKDDLLDAQYEELSSIVDYNAARADFRNIIRIDEIGK